MTWGDDNIAIKAGKKIAGREFACENITVSDCTFVHGHGMSIGSETGGGVRNVIVKNCTFENTENGIRIKSQAGKGGIVENISYSDITMKNVDPAITFTCYYMNNSAKDAAPTSAAQESPASITGEKIQFTATSASPIFKRPARDRRASSSVCRRVVFQTWFLKVLLFRPTPA
ncbi:MAG: glycosyl hydrolase family 28 protein [Limisphaerales bacterium]